LLSVHYPVYRVMCVRDSLGAISRRGTASGYTPRASRPAVAV